MDSKGHYLLRFLFIAKDSTDYKKFLPVLKERIKFDSEFTTTGRY
jgi:hypothetical protein